jgi:hypothetical protein
MSDPTVTFVWPPTKKDVISDELNYNFEENRKWLADRNNGSTGTKFAFLDAIETFTAKQSFTGDIAFPSLLGVARVYNVKDYGALGDGSNDDTTSIQAAIDAAEAVFGGIVTFPRGTYKITSVLTVKHTIYLLGLGGVVEGADSDYTTDAGSPNTKTMGVIIYQVTANTGGLLIRQSPIGTYKIQVNIDNILFIGPNVDTVASTSGDGIKVDPQDVNFGIKCIFKNVSSSWFGGYGINLAEGYYGSYFENITVNGANLTGFHAAGSSQGEWMLTNLRAFGNGTGGATEADQAGLYVGSGGGISLYRISCTSNYRVQAYFSGCTFTMVDFWSESFAANNANDRSLILSGCNPKIIGAGFSPQSPFLGKVIDCRTATNGFMTGLRVFSTVDPTGYHIYEDGTSGSNVFQTTGYSGTLYNNLSPDSTFGVGNAVNQIVLNTPAASLVTYLKATTPATASRTVTIPDPGAAANVVLSESAQTLNGALSLTSDLTLKNKKGAIFQDTALTPKAITVTAPTTLTNSHTYRLPLDQGGANQYLTNDGSGNLSWGTAAGTGTVNTGTANRLAYYASSTNAVTAWSAITGSKALASDSNGLPVASATTAAELAFVNGVTSAIQTQLNLKSPLASPTFTGTVTAATLDAQTLLKGKGTATNDDAAAGYIGEYIESSITSATNYPSTGTWGDLTSISLTAGDWDVSAMIQQTTPGTMTGESRLGISTTSGNSATGLVIGKNRLTHPNATATADTGMSIMPYRLSLSGTTTVYFKYFTEFSAGTPKAVGTIRARRVR